ncbi:MAG: DUF6447 family protein [Burkholderiales bacterium]|nr:DUF6447 family protein [Burkholderiales bacterium]
MTIIKVDGKEYDSDALSDATLQQLQSLQFVDKELSRLAAQVAVCQTARVAYANALRESLAASLQPFAGDTIKLG